MSHPAALPANLDALTGRAPQRTRMRTVPWNISGDRFREICDALKFEYLKWDMYLGGKCRILPESIVLSRETHAHLVSVTEAFAGLMRRFESNVRRDRRLMAELGIEPRLFPLLESDCGDMPAFSRADFFLTPDGRWVLSEFNEDVPGGFNEAAGVPALLDAGELGGEPVGDLRRSLCEAFSDCATVGMVFATAFSEDLQHASVLARWLRAAGHDTVHGSPEHLRDHWNGPRLAGVPVQGIFRFYPAEWLPLLPNIEVWRRALPRLRMMNPPLRLASQSKRSFGLWRSGIGVHGADCGLARKYCPESEDFHPCRIQYYRTQREHLVLKQAFGRMGDSVLVGALATQQEWDGALTFAARKPRDVAMQQRFLVEPLFFESGFLYPTVGVYAVDGRFAGYYSRVAPEPFITHEAFHVATVVETA
jgi:hypothetical protein